MNSQGPEPPDEAGEIIVGPGVQVPRAWPTG